MRRIGLAVVLAVSLTQSPLVANAQSAGGIYRIGYLSLQRPEGDRSWVAAFRQGLRDLGYAEGKNIVIQLLVAALGFAGLPRPSYNRSLRALRAWLDFWSGIGRIAVGMHRQGRQPGAQFPVIGKEERDGS